MKDGCKRVALITIAITALTAGNAVAICPVSDLDGNCRVGFEDLVLLAQQWLASTAGPSDLTGDEQVDVSDLGILAGNWRQVNLPLVINEVMASNTKTVKDPQSEYDDWIELFNAGDYAIDVGGNVGTTGILTIDGGVMNNSGHLWVASYTDAIGTVDITGGTLSVGGMIGIGTIDAVNPSGGTGTVNVNDGGLLALANIHAAGTSIHPGSMLNLYGTGRVTLPGDFEGVITNYAAAGLISGDGIPGNIKTDLTTNPGFTTITVIPEPATMILLGLGGLLLRRKK